MTPLNLDKDGFLKNLGDWNERVAAELASLDTLMLTDAHWEIIHFVRRYYRSYNLTPTNRALVNAVRQEFGPEKGNSMYLMRLFTGKPAKVLSRVAGLPRPTNCD